MEDASKIPNLVRGLMECGVSDDDTLKIRVVTQCELCGKWSGLRLPLADRRKLRKLFRNSSLITRRTMSVDLRNGGALKSIG
jgi:hypothetical protein